MSWQRIDLSHTRYAVPPQPPAWCNLIYAGKRHLVSAPPESVKTLLCWLLLQAAPTLVELLDRPGGQEALTPGASG